MQKTPAATRLPPGARGKGFPRRASPSPFGRPAASELGLEPIVFQLSDNQIDRKALVPNLPYEKEVWNRSFHNHLQISDLQSAWCQPHR